MARSVVVLWCLVLAACSSGSSTPTAPSPPPPRVAQVEYKVTGILAETASLTYATSSGGTAQIARAVLPWSLRFQATAGQFLYLSAQDNGPVPPLTVSGLVEVQILLDGVVWKRASSSGAYTIATVSGSF